MIFEWFQTLCIFIIFFSLLSVNLFGSGVQNMKDNWALYRCNPIIMPLAGYISPDGTSTEDNFSFCIQSIISSFAPNILQPFSYLQNMTIDMMDSINTSDEKTTEQTSDIRDNVTNIIKNIYSVFINVIIEFNIIVIKLIDTQGKMTAIMASIMHIMTTVQYTFESMWNGVPGEMIRFINKYKIM
jgi:hypothetical protein